uniref:DNA-directed DNA polymerase n=2 Tax=Macrostomum lignano TaxID=282301 RepID=A0A1I8JAK4_9PLAT
MAGGSAEGQLTQYGSRMYEMQPQPTSSSLFLSLRHPVAASEVRPRLRLWTPGRRLLAAVAVAAIQTAAGGAAADTNSGAAETDRKYIRLILVGDQYFYSQQGNDSAAAVSRLWEIGNYVNARTENDRLGCRLGAPGKLCSSAFGGGSQFRTGTPTAIGWAITVAHELGAQPRHEPHDEDERGCHCPDRQGCIMAAVGTEINPMRFSNCSVFRYQDFSVDNGLGYCMSDPPSVANAGRHQERRAATGIVEPGEDCDCGRASEERHAFSKHYVRITNSDKRCLLRALVVACAYLQFVAKSITKRVWHTIKANSPTQTKLVAELQIEAGLYTTLQTVSQAAIRALNRLHPGRDFGVRVYRAEEANRCIFNLPGTEILHLHLVEQHFNVVTKLPAFFGSDHYCPKCEMAYDCANAEAQPPEHQCGYAKCPVCKQYDETATHECFVTPPKAKESSAPYVYYDFETYVDSGKQHRVHLVTAATSCEACPKLFPRPRCSVCGGLHSSANCIAGRDLALDFTSCVSHNDCACGMREFVSVGPHSIDAFYCWLTSVFKQGAIAIAHNGSAYDAFLLLGALLNGLAKKKPQVIFQNSRLMYMKCDKITFKDSLNFIPIGLAQFPKALGLGTQLTKGDFPHVFNQPQNWGYVGPYCSIDMYGGKKNKQHDSIADWLAKQEGQVFNFNKEYLDYCLQDTLILREGCLKYARLIKDICGLDAFVQSNTIAGLAMSVFTTKFMEPNTLGDEGAPVQQPIRLEDALFGGRTEAFVPHAEATETVELRYRDVVSLYPTVNKFDKYPLKAESSGSPGMAEDAKAAYMASFFEREGVRLEKVEENPGLRFVAKIFLNSLWGKFCQRDDLTSTEIVDSYEAWLQRLTDPSIKVKSCEPIGESFMMLEYKPRFGGAGERAFKYANVPIGVFTTSHARLRLYEALEGLGTRVIYADTDSVVYRCSPGEYEPPGGSSLGQWTDEVPAGCRMVQFTTGGPKLYRYVVEKPDRSLYSVLKCKGIRVTPEISEREDELQEILRHGGSVRLPQAQFRRDKASCTIRTLEMDKTFQRVMTKRWCNNTCCNPSTCKLASGAACASGQCCNLTTCSLKSQGVVCRPRKRACDLEEYCNGTSEWCPEFDDFMIDGSECLNGQAYCFNGRCSDRNTRCSMMFNASDFRAAPAFYSEATTQASQLGYCDYSMTGISPLAYNYTGCSHENQRCGLLYCTSNIASGDPIPVWQGANLADAKVFEGSVNSTNVIAAFMQLDLRSSGYRDPGLVPNGAECGTGRMCVDSQCVAINTTRCPNCNGNGWCTQSGQCFCSPGFAPPSCLQAGTGGSMTNHPPFPATSTSTTTTTPTT